MGGMSFGRIPKVNDIQAADNISAALRIGSLDELKVATLQYIQANGGDEGLVFSGNFFRYAGSDYQFRALPEVCRAAFPDNLSAFREVMQFVVSNSRGRVSEFANRMLQSETE